MFRIKKNFLLLGCLAVLVILSSQIITADWVVENASDCYNITSLKVSGNNLIGEFSKTGLNFSDVKEIVIVDAFCNITGTIINRTVLEWVTGSGTGALNGTILVNDSKNYSMYINNPTPTTERNLTYDYCEFSDGTMCNLLENQSTALSATVSGGRLNFSSTGGVCSNIDTGAANLYVKYKLNASGISFAAGITNRTTPQYDYGFKGAKGAGMEAVYGADNNEVDLYGSDGSSFVESAIITSGLDGDEWISFLSMQSGNCTSWLWNSTDLKGTQDTSIYPTTSNMRICLSDYSLSGNVQSVDAIRSYPGHAIFAGPGSVNLSVGNVQHKSAPPSDTCTCPGANNDWEINMSDFCQITDDCNLETGNLSFVDSGNCSLNATLNVSNMDSPSNNSILWILSDAMIFIH